MKTKIIYLFLMVSNFYWGQAQDNSKDKIEKIKALKVAFITNKLNLNKEEAEKFWPIYNAFDEKQYELRENKIKAIHEKLKDGGIEKISDKEAANYLSQLETYEEELFALRKKFIKEIKGIIGAKKTLKLKKVEEDFNRSLLKKMREQKKKI